MPPHETVSYVSYVASRVRSEDEGISAMEYGVMVVLIALVLAVGATALSGGPEALLQRITDSLS